LKTDVFDDIAVHHRVDCVVIAAKRVMALRGAIGVIQFVEIARALAVVKNDLLVKLCEIVKHSY